MKKCLCHYHEDEHDEQATEAQKAEFEVTKHKFVEVAAKLLRLWEDMPNGYASEKYPFPESFDEMVLRMVEWKNSDPEEGTL